MADDEVSGVEKLGKYVYKLRRTGGMRVDALILSDWETLDREAVEQLRNVATLPGIVKEAFAMPDIHWGYGFPIGGVAAFDARDGVISPGGVGFDINCGVRMLVADGPAELVKKNIDAIIKKIYELVPVGVGETSELKLSKSDFKRIVTGGAKVAVELGYGASEDLECIEDFGSLKDCDFSAVSSEAVDRGKDELGTLGAGNHFIEVQEVVEVFDRTIAEVFGVREGDITVLIHTGSRGFGHQIATDYIRLMRDELRDHNRDLPDKQLINAPFESELGQRYYSAMNCAANYAFANRQIITYMIRKAFKSLLGMNLRVVYDVAHNIAKLEEYTIDGQKKRLIVHRKGATRSFGPNNSALPNRFRKTGQPVVIPGSMGTSSYLLVGTAKAEEWTFGSTAHGAGRTLGRREASRELTSEKVIEELKARGIKLMAKSKKGIVEEAPQAYKNVDKVVQIVHELGISLKVARCVPLAVVKG